MAIPVRISRPVQLTRSLEGWARRLANKRRAGARIGGELARLAARRAPRGDSRRGQSLQASIGYSQPSDNSVAVTSGKPYAGIQNRGGTIKPGGGKLHARMLVIPLNDTARRILDGLGATQSLRDVEGLIPLKTRKGRLVLVRQLATPLKGKRGKSKRGMKREHRFGSGQVLFVLTGSATLKPNPLPDGYVPKAGSAEVLRIVQETLRRWVVEGRV